ncbi:hypothetical protein [Paenibacillus sp. 1P07SE]|uniref:hypothetical protein n=1 Tax=Paenibacillus sp. 1P07SE TaxID=3132209 RepID=UPI0039A69A58
MTYSPRYSPKWLTAVALSATLMFSSAAAYAAEPTAIHASQQVYADGPEQYQQFLAAKYDVSLQGTITKGQFIAAVAHILSLTPSGEAVAFTDLTSSHSLFADAAALYEAGILSGPAIQPNQTLTNSVAVSIAVRAAGLKELAYTYPEAKVNQVLAKLGVGSGELSKGMAQELAAAVDTGVLPAAWLANYKPHHTASESLYTSLLGQVLVNQGLYKQYIGYVYDQDIALKIQTAYHTADLFEAPKLQELVNEALEQELVTGYNIKDSRYDANFIPELTLTYGHSNLKHAIQLIGLLKSEQLNAKVQYEPKTSAFLHLAEWGDPGPNVIQIENGNYIAFSLEYDLVFEFANAADKAAFQDVVLTYAKKNEADQQGLIHGSWWQPLYFSETELADYEIITNNLITDPDSTYSVHPFSLNEDSERVVEGFKAIDPSAVITPYQFWVDKPFFNYLHGESL